MKIYLPILVIIISILSCSKEGEPADGKVNEGIAVDKSTLRDIPLDNGIDSLDTIERLKDSVAKVERARLDSIDKVEKAKLKSELDSLKLVEEQNEKINELLTYLENPIEANYNYDWNKKEEKFISDSLGLDLLDQVFRRRQELTIKELTKFIKDVTVSEFKDLWFYESYVWDNNELDSLTLLAYYLKNDDITHIGDGSNYLDHKDALPSFNSGDIKCLFNEHQDTLIFNNDICDFDTEAERLNIDIDNYCSFIVLFDEHRINGFKFDVSVTCNEGGNGTGSKVMVLSNSDGDMKFLYLSEDYGHEWYAEGVSTKVSFDGKFEVEIYLRSDSESFELENSQQIYFNKYYSVVLDYELNDQMELVFKGIRKINYIM